MNATSEHIDESAELYALGALSDAERASVEAHVSACAACARRVGEAEETVAFWSSEAEVPQRLDRRVHASLVRRATTRTFYPLVAAALIVGLLPSLFLWQRDRDRGAIDAMQQQAQVAMIHSHFLHAPFVPLSQDGPAAKLIFARTGSWIYVLASTDRSLTVAAEERTSRVALGTLEGSGAQREFFTNNRPAATAIVLLDGSRPVARAALPVTR